jgi:hypothetical protein
LNEGGGAGSIASGGSDISADKSESVEAELFVNNPPSPLIRAAQPPRSFARLGARQNNGEGDANQDVMQEGERRQQNDLTAQARGQQDRVNSKPKEERLTRAHPFNGDLRTLSHRKPVQRERPELEGPESNPTFAPGTPATAPSAPEIGGPSAPAPAPDNVFEGLDRLNWGAGSPPDTNGDVGPNYYIQTVNTSIGVFRKSDGFREAAFTFDTFMSQGNFGNLCDNHNFGDPVVLYDTFEDRWIITDFAFVLDASNNVLAPAYQCIAASKTGDPLTGGWNFYSIKFTDALGDYPKFGIWPDGLYMSANMFSFGAGATFQNARVFAFDKAQMYAGSPTVKVVTFNVGGGDFTVIPSNARLQTGTPPVGRPNLFLSTQLFLNALTVYKFHVDWNSISLSSFTGPDTPISATSWPAFAAGVPQPGTGTLLDSLSNRAMAQNQYTNFSGTESLWVSHTVRRGNTAGFAAPRWYQVNVNGGTVAGTIPQAATWDPDGANVLHRWMPSLALDRAGDMAMGYSKSSTTVFPSIAYAGRLAADPVNTFSKTEQTFFTGTASQTGSVRWGDYSAMTLDPDGCTFWYTTEYANPASQASNQRWLTKFGSFRFAECTPVGAGGTVSGTVTNSATSNPISGATVTLGSRTTTTTNVSGVYTFSNVPAGVYPSITASFAGFGSSTVTSVVVNDSATTTQDFSLTAAPQNACLVDTSQADFLLGVATGLDLNTSPGDVTLSDAPNVDQKNQTVTNSGFGFTSTSWAGQTFTSAITGQLTRIDLDLFCSGCTGTTPNITVSIRATSGSPAVPTGPDLATATIPGFNSGAGGYFSANFSTPATLTAGTQYAVVIRAVSNPSAGVYAYVCSCTNPNSNPYANGQRVTSTNSGSTWTADTTVGGRDLGFIAYMKTGFPPTGNLISGLKDANPLTGSSLNWTQLSWTAATPANTGVQFQVAASNNINGPFTFVGPDGTAATFFNTSGASLTQFNGFRYLKYKLLLNTTDSATTPTVSDVTACFVDITFAAAAPLSRQQGFAPVNSQIATVSDPSQTANTLNVTATPLTGSGVTVGNISIDASGNVTADVAASCTATNSTFTLTVTDTAGGTATAILTVNVTPSVTPTIMPSGPTTFCTGGSVTLTSSGASGNQWYLNGNPIGGATAQQYVATASGDYTVTTNSCNLNPSAATTVTVNPTPATPTVTPGGPTTFCAGGSVGLSSSSATGNQWYLNGNLIGGATNQTYSATASGNYTVIVTASGCPSAPSAATAVTVNPIPATPTITPSGQAALCNGSVTLSSSSVTGNQWYLNGNPIGGATNQTYSATATGNYTVVVTTSGCSSAASSTTTVVANPAPVLTYATPSAVIFNNSLVINPATGPSDNTSVSSISVQSTGTYTGTISVNNTTGVVSISNAAPAGTHTITIRATDSCGAFTDASFTLTVNKADQGITFGALSGKNFGDAPFTVSATGGNSGNPVTFSSQTSAVCTVSSSTVTILSTGNCTIRASQAGNSNYNAAPDIDRIFTVAKGNQTITVNTHAPATAAFNSSFTVAATSNSALSVTYGSSGACTNTGATFTMTNGTGPCTVTYDQAGNSNYNAASQVVETVNAQQVASAIAVISSANPSNLGQSVTFTASVTSATGTPTGTVTFKDGGSAISGCSNAALSAGQATCITSSLSAGNHTITADYSGDTNFLSSTGTLLGGQVVLTAISLDDVSVTEGDTGTKNFNFTVTLSQASNLTVKIDFATANGTATAGNDYQATSGTLTFNPGDLTKTITVVVNGDTTNEADETFFVNLTNPQNATLSDNQGLGTILNDDAPGIQFSSPIYSIGENGLHATITVNRVGDTSGPATVDYATSDNSGLTPCSTANGMASQRCDYVITVGRLRFVGGESSKTIFIPIIDDVYVEGPETFTITLGNPTGGSLGATSTATITINDNDLGGGSNPISGTDFFIRQNYLDFLNREPEPTGFAGWQNILNNCGTSVQQPCDRIEVSSDFFRSDEFQQRGYFIYRFYTTLGRIPHYSEFIPDMARVSGFLSTMDLESMKVAFVQDFMSRQEFQTKYGSFTDPATYVDALLQTVGLPNHPMRGTWITGLTNATLTRAQVLRALIESPELYTKFYNEAFVVEMYFGYLRRDPDILYLQWLQTLNQTGDYRALVKGFLTANEYVLRFGP